MRKMNYYQNPYYFSTTALNPDLRNDEAVKEKILQKIKEKATAIDLYDRLMNAAPNQDHINEIYRVMVNENNHWQQFVQLYIALSGKQPEYEIEGIPFHSYQEGIQKAYETELKNFEDYRDNGETMEKLPPQNIFLRAYLDDMDHVRRIHFLGTHHKNQLVIKDFGPKPYVVNIEDAAKQNNTYRTALWTGPHLQVTLMSINVGEDIGLEIHRDTDQFLRIEQGQGIVQMGKRKDQLNFQEKVFDDYAIMIPAGTWHNVTNTGRVPLKLYSIYAPPNHPHGTVHKTKAQAMAAE